MERSQTIDEILAKVGNMSADDSQSTMASMIRKMSEIISEKQLTNIMDHFDGLMTYYNYLSEDEAKAIVENFRNADGSEGAFWSNPDLFFEKAEEAGFKIESEPYYNRWSFYAVANMMVSDYGTVLEKVADGNDDKFLSYALDLSVARLKDIDRPHFVREYFKI